MLETHLSASAPGAPHDLWELPSPQESSPFDKGQGSGQWTAGSARASDWKALEPWVTMSTPQRWAPLLPTGLGSESG